MTSVMIGQWSPLLAGAALTPALGGLLALKPQAALVWLAVTLSPSLLRRIVVTGVLVSAVSFAVDPDWLFAWLGVLGEVRHMESLFDYAVAWPFLLALLRWRDPGARALLALFVVPINKSLYEWVPVFVAARTRAQMMVLALASIVASFSAADIFGLATRATVAVWLGYPALAMVLARPHGGAVPAWAERLAARLRSLRPVRT
jgi:hypothetical protein